MICNNCGVENKGDAGFCAHCGSPMEAHVAPQTGDEKKCPSCGFRNPRQSKFCGRCGVNLKAAQRAARVGRPIRKEKRNRKGYFDPVGKWHPAAVAVGLVAGCFVIVVGLQLFRNSLVIAPTAQVIETRSTDPKVEARVLAIAGRFICSCGSCGELPLDTCTCGTAIEERQFIRNAIQGGQDDGQIIAALKEAYGWMRPDSGSQTANGVSLAARKNPIPTPGLPSTRLAGNDSGPVGDDRFATAADREEIFSQFHCPCGQCGVDDLNTCTCTHPRGATEVKAFVDRRIAEKNATIAQLINEVESKYGNRIYQR